jgi:hypothetical protein
MPTVKVEEQTVGYLHSGNFFVNAAALWPAAEQYWPKWTRR